MYEGHWIETVVEWWMVLMYIAGAVLLTMMVAILGRMLWEVLRNIY
jgi:fluoride ion exporter CrcB/FEX